MNFLSLYRFTIDTHLSCGCWQSLSLPDIVEGADLTFHLLGSLLTHSPDLVVTVVVINNILHSQLNLKKKVLLYLSQGHNFLPLTWCDTVGKCRDTNLSKNGCICLTT